MTRCPQVFQVPLFCLILVRRTPSCGLGGEGFRVQQGLDKVANRCGGTLLCNSTKIGCCYKPQFSLLVPQTVFRLVSCILLNVVAFVIWDFQLSVVEFLAELQ